MFGFIWFLCLLALSQEENNKQVLDSEFLLSKIEQLEQTNKNLMERLEYVEQLAKLNAPRTCHSLTRNGVTKSGMYEIDSDGSGIGENSFKVYCDMNTGTTEVSKSSLASATQMNNLIASSDLCKSKMKDGHLVIQCKGEAPFNSGGSCDDLRKAGVTISGYYLVRSPLSNITEAVFCDMSGFPKSSRTQNSLGPLAFQDEPSVMFDVSLKAPCSNNYNGYLSFYEAHLSMGGGIDEEKGTFTAPTRGTYLFMLHGQMYLYSSKSVYISQNGNIKGRIQGGSNDQEGYGMVSQSVILQVEMGDVIQVYSDPCTILGGSSYSHFIGILLKSQ